MAAPLTAEQTDLRDTVAALVSKRGQDSDLWAELAAMGLVGLIIPEEYGGSGAGATELAVVAEQFGAGLLPAPFLSTAVLAPYLLLALGDTAECADVLPRISAGEVIATVAFAEAGSARPPEHPSSRAEPSGEGWRITGEKTYVLDAPAADLFYVLAETASGSGVFAVDTDAPGVRVTGLSTVDQTRGMGAVSMTDTPARRVGGDGAAALQTALDRAAVALIAEQAGGAMRAMTMASDYARTRYQFGRAIGSFQAIKHMCVDMLLEAQSAVSAARHVAAAFDAGEPDRLTDLALAQAYCSEAFVTVAANTIQVHGGIGFTWEHPAHRYLRRARTDAQIFGDPAWHRERYVRLREEVS